MDTAQLILLIVVVVLASLFIFLGMQVFFILGEIRKSAQKVNKILDQAEMVTENIARPLSDMSGIFAGIKTGLSVLGIFNKKKKHHHSEEDEENE